MPPTNSPKKRKPRTNYKPYVRGLKPGPKRKDLPKTSATQLPKHARSNLTLNDWLTVVAYHDSHPNVSQQEVVEHFAQLREGSLKFNQSNLSRHLSKKGCEHDLARLQANPTALSAKRVQVVTRPDVEKALFLWVKHMEEKGEHVTGPMLVAKHTRFEELMNVPEDERLKSNGWVQKFCSAYGLQEFRRHGEAGSVDLEAVEKECIRLAVLLAGFLKKD